MTRIAFQTLLRAACVSELTKYGTSAGVNLQVYPGRPVTLFPPAAFVDGIDETIDYDGLVQRHPVARVVAVWGLYDSKDATEQRDAFVDGLLNQLIDDYHAVDGATLISVTNIADDPSFVPDWGSEQQRTTTYYATRFNVEGLALEGG